MSYPNIHKVQVKTFIFCYLWGFEECSRELYAHKYVDMGLDVNVRASSKHSHTHTEAGGCSRSFENLPESRVLVWSNAAGYTKFVPLDDKEQRWPLLNRKKLWLAFTGSGGTAGSLEHRYQATYRPHEPKSQKSHARGGVCLAWHPEGRPCTCHPESSA